MRQRRRALAALLSICLIFSICGGDVMAAGSQLYGTVKGLEAVAEEAWKTAETGQTEAESSLLEKLEESQDTETDKEIAGEDTAS